MKIGSFEFNLRELAGSLGDFGTLLPPEKLVKPKDKLYKKKKLDNN